MKGAEEFSRLFETGQYGRLYIVSAVGRCGASFRVFLLPAGEPAIVDRHNSPPLNDGSVEVYGATDGRADCDACFGWLRAGPWQHDFAGLVEACCAARNAGAETDDDTPTDLPTVRAALRLTSCAVC